MYNVWLIIADCRPSIGQKHTYLLDNYAILTQYSAIALRATVFLRESCGDGVCIHHQGPTGQLRKVHKPLNSIAIRRIRLVRSIDFMTLNVVVKPGLLRRALEHRHNRRVRLACAAACGQ